MTCIAFLLAADWGAAEEEQPWTERLELSGFLETLQSMRLREPHDAVTSRARLRLGLGADLGPVYGFVSADARRTGS